MMVAVLPALFAVYYPSCRTPKVMPTMPAETAPMSELWRPPENISARDLFHGSWGPEHAPDPHDAFTFVKSKTSGVNPGMTVVDSLGRSWSVKQGPHDDRGAEGPVEVMLSRILEAVGYHQPPVYHVASFTLADTFGTRIEPGGRFRLQHPHLKERGTWSWQQNPFVGTPPYQGLLAILLLFNSSDLKNSNNTMYEYRVSPGVVERWYVVRDLGTALGSPARLRPLRNDIVAFEHMPYVAGVQNGFVLFDYRGWHKELVEDRITLDDVRWASVLLAQLTDTQWYDAFRAGGYEQPLAARFIRRIQAKIADGLALAATSQSGPQPGVDAVTGRRE
jgi:hypothetical protein